MIKLSVFKNTKIQIVIFYVFLFILCFTAGLKDDVMDVDIWPRLIMGHHVVNYGSVMYKDIVRLVR